MTNEIVLIIFYFLTLVYSVIIHEVSHGVVALWLGDMTAKYAGRLTLNPISHIDPFGTLLLPLTLGIISHGALTFGYAKPVPYNPYNLREQKWGPLYVALAGPGSNFLLAFIASILAKLMPLSLIEKADILKRFYGVIGGSGDFLERFGYLAEAMSGTLPTIFFGLLLLIIFWNVVLGCFNLLPIPPLDGSKLLFTLFPFQERTQLLLEQYGFFLLLFLIFVLSGPVSAFISFFLRLFFGFTL
ncbi:MAG: site-2 protease family protein [Candidatus Moraniibacteriota bacterium]